MSTHTRLKALEAEAAKKKPKRKTKAKRDEHGRFIKKLKIQQTLIPHHSNDCTN